MYVLCLCQGTILGGFVVVGGRVHGSSIKIEYIIADWGRCTEKMIGINQLQLLHCCLSGRGRCPVPWHSLQGLTEWINGQDIY